jgi:hypothetical protein
VVLSGGSAASAQTDYAIDSGSFIVGCSVSSRASAETMEDRGLLVSVNPILQYFVAPHLALGGAFDVRHVSGSDLENRAATSTVGIGPRVGYYFGDSGWRVYPFLGGTVFVSRFIIHEQSVPQLGTLDPPDRTIVDIQPSGGAAFMIAKNVAITGEVFYRLNFTEFEGESDAVDSNEFGLRFGVAAFVY